MMYNIILDVESVGKRAMLNHYIHVRVFHFCFFMYIHSFSVNGCQYACVC